ncbi:ATP-dependent helicase [Haloechinothrix sp. YIM 98757]|uniref:ATP-dependent helicase n=1 Tax=Haloechinothrix aidingensis TaxID=2752311 RepID=A0A838A7H8_9PSEU|nr:UvrD-helicase domain-containing protein [Haloechinothrix aidingensis]MBA0124497.1 ATP-dependent helicase [Haloechinothrix aidingensis]
MPARFSLTDEQRRAAASRAEHVFIIAAPGAGKTTIAAERYGVTRFADRDPGRRTIGVSFARSATQEFRIRVQQRWGTRAVGWPHDIKTLDSLHCELVRHLLVTGTLRWPGGHTELKVLDIWRGQRGARYLQPNQGWRRVATLHGRDVTSVGTHITRPGYGIGTKQHFETHLANGLCTHEEIRAVLQAALSRDDLRQVLADYLRNTTRSLIVDEVFDANDLDVDLILLAGKSGLRTTLIGDPWQALYEFRGAQPDLVPQLVKSQGYLSLPVTESFRFATHEMRHIAIELRAGRGVAVEDGSAGEVDVVLAPEWGMLWQSDARVLPLSFGRVDNQTEAGIILLLDQVVTERFDRRAIFAPEAMALLGLEPETVQAEGSSQFRQVLETISHGTPEAMASALNQLRSALKELGSPRQLRTLPGSGEEKQRARLHSLAQRLNQARCIPGMTIHQAKGKEWPTVGVRVQPTQADRIRTGLTESSANDRALYVALTRASESVRFV